jgi:hypothetical protein
MEFKRIAAATALTVAVAAPAFGQEPAPRSVSAQNQLQREQAYRHRYESGFWPADVAAGIVGGAIGTAGAIAAAPFGAGYAYNGPYGYAYNQYGNACKPGTRFRGADGLIHVC